MITPVRYACVKQFISISDTEESLLLFSFTDNNA